MTGGTNSQPVLVEYSEDTIPEGHSPDSIQPSFRSRLDNKAPSVVNLITNDDLELQFLT